MLISDVAPIRFDLMERALTRLISLRYLELAANESILDAKYDEVRSEAIDDFHSFVSDDEPEVEDDVRRALVYVLNVKRKRFEECLRILGFPLPRWDPAAAHAILCSIWETVWADWRVPDFDELEFEIVTRVGGGQEQG